MGSKVEEVKYGNARMMMAIFKLEERRLGVMQMYSPHQGRPMDEKVDFYDQMQREFDVMNIE